MQFQESDNERRSSKMILLCDDDVFIMRAAELKLRSAGFHVQLSHDGVEAWELLSGGGRTFDALITDRQMPHMDGLELVNLIRNAQDQWLRKLPIILLTSRSHDLPPDFAVDAMIDKPFSPRDLVKRIQLLLTPAVEEFEH